PITASFITVSRSSAHRDLHSFPTRRSSDLAGERGHRRERGEEGSSQHHDCRFCGSASISSSVSTSRTSEYGFSINRVRGRERSIDRKSTRLNSSHVSISHADFCLKKKNKSN